MRILVILAALCVCPIRAFAKGCAENATADINQIASKTPAPLPSLKPIIKSEPYDGKVVDGCAEECTRQSITGMSGLERPIAITQPVDALFPGSLIRASSLAKGDLALIALKRSPAILTATSINPELSGGGRQGASVSVRVAEPTLPSVTAAVNRLVGRLANSVTAAKIEFREETGQSYEEAFFKVGLNAKALGVLDLTSQLTKSSNSTQSKYVATLVQSFYEISYAPPEVPGEIFCESVSKKQLSATLAADDSLAYISTVTYGRIMVIAASAAMTEDELKANMRLAIDLGLGSGDATGETKLKSFMSKTVFQASVLGGDAKAGSLLVADKNPVTAVRHFIKGGASFSSKNPALPIFYRARYLKDNTTAQTVLAADYIISSCVPKACCAPFPTTLEPSAFADMEKADVKYCPSAVPGTIDLTFKNDASGRPGYWCDFVIKNAPGSDIHVTGHFGPNESRTHSLALASYANRRVRVELFNPGALWAIRTGTFEFNVPASGSMKIEAVCKQP